MILYFDIFITDVPLNKNFVDSNKWIRSSCPAYRMPSKIEIAKYTLASYAVYPWTKVLIRFSVADTSYQKEFEDYARSLFPQATILTPCSSDQKSYQESLEILNQWDDDWVWYAPNNDHPIVTHDLSIIDTLLEKANSYTNEHDFISIPYSHFSEYVNLPKKGSAFWKLFGKDVQIIEETEDALVCIRQNGDNTAVQIANKKLLNHWFGTYDLSNAKIIRSEDVRGYYLTKNQLLVIPKKEIAAHFDGYSHTMKGLAEIAPEQIPPLFIPSGFFTNDIKIKYGFKEYDENYTNINPYAKKYSFEDQIRGTDLKLDLENLPIFWKDKISKIEINNNLEEGKIKRAAEKKLTLLNNPYSLKNKPLNINTLTYLLKSLLWSLKCEIFPTCLIKYKRIINGFRRRYHRIFKLHPTSNPYICGDNFRAIADHILDMDSSINPTKVKKNDIVFIQSFRVKEFLKDIHPKITNPYILVTHNGDENITEEHTKFIDEKIIHWFAQNCRTEHSKLTPIPIGIENKWYYLHGIPKYFDNLRQVNPYKHTLILYKFSVNTNPAERGKALKILDKSSLTETYNDWRESYAYLRTLQNYKFVASPVGNGEDCIRTWEAMYLGSIPIVTNSPTTRYFASLGLPIVIINDWSEIDKMTPKYLEETYAKMSALPKTEALWSDFWINEIKNKKI